MTCGDWINLRQVHTGEAALVNHEGKKQCLEKLERNKEKQEYIAATAALDDLQRITPLSYSPLSLKVCLPLELIFFRLTQTLINSCPGVPLIWDENDLQPSFPCILGLVMHFKTTKWTFCFRPQITKTEKS
jgi:hypothetical protein